MLTRHSRRCDFKPNRIYFQLVLFFILIIPFSYSHALDYDFDGDRDVDGKDLAEWAMIGCDVGFLSREFGKLKEGATYFSAKISGQWYLAKGAWPSTSDIMIDDINHGIVLIADGDTLVLSGGIEGETYSGMDLDATDGIDIGRNGVTIRKADISDPDYALHIGEVDLDGTDLDDHVLVINSSVSEFTLTGIKISNADNGYFNIYANGNSTFNDVVISSGYRGIKVAADVIFNRCIISKTSTFWADMLTAGGSLTLNYSLVVGCGSPCRFWQGTLTCNNSVFTAQSKAVLDQAKQYSAISNFTNCIIAGNATTQDSEILINTSDGTMTATNCLLLPDGLGCNSWTGLTDGGGNVYELARWVSDRRPAKIALVIDDSGNRLLWDMIAKYATSKGVPIVLSCDEQSSIAETDAADPLGCGWESLRARVAEGHEIASHCLSHVNCGTISESELEYHLTQSKVLIEAGIGSGYVCKSFVYPGGQYGEDDTNKDRVTSAVRDAGYTIARGIASTAKENRFMEDHLIYRTHSQLIPLLIGTSNIKRNLAAIIATAASIGGVVTLYAHGDDGTYGNDYSGGNLYTLEHWKDLIDAIADMGAQSYFNTLSEIGEYIRANGTDADGEGKRWTRTFADSADYQLQADSPCINAGTDIPALDGKNDFYGNYIDQKHNIGISEFVIN